VSAFLLDVGCTWCCVFKNVKKAVCERVHGEPEKARIKACCSLCGGTKIAKIGRKPNGGLPQPGNASLFGHAVVANSSLTDLPCHSAQARRYALQSVKIHPPIFAILRAACGSRQPAIVFNKAYLASLLPAFFAETWTSA
jgi:hypothetical protein